MTVHQMLANHAPWRLTVATLAQVQRIVGLRRIQRASPHLASTSPVAGASMTVHQMLAKHAPWRLTVVTLAQVQRIVGLRRIQRASLHLASISPVAGASMTVHQRLAKHAPWRPIVATPAEVWLTAGPRRIRLVVPCQLSSIPLLRSILSVVGANLVARHMLAKAAVWKLIVETLTSAKFTAGHKRMQDVAWCCRCEAWPFDTTLVAADPAPSSSELP